MEGMDSDRADGGGSGALEKLTSKLSGFLSDARNIKASQFVLSAIALCYMETDLAYWMWVELFPKLWAVLSDRQRTVRTCCAGRAFLLTQHSGPADSAVCLLSPK